MKWFGRKAAREAARPFLLRGAWGAMGAEALPRSYEAQVREAVCANAVAQRCVRLVAEAVGSVSVYDGAQEGGDSPSAGSGKAVALISNNLIETAATHLLLHGNAFLAVAQDAAAMPAVEAIGPELPGWRLVSLAMVRSRVVAAAGSGARKGEGPGWTAVVDYRARLLRA
jgi:phage portal protein BeeE